MLEEVLELGSRELEEEEAVGAQPTTSKAVNARNELKCLYFILNPSILFVIQRNKVVTQ
jgi:hypothetical protein